MTSQRPERWLKFHVLSRYTPILAAAVLPFALLCLEVRAASSGDLAAVRLIQQRCVKCHNAERAKGGIDLSGLESALEVWKDRSIFTRALDMIERGVMPPEEQPDLPDGDRRQITQWLSHTLDHVDVSLIPRDPGTVPPRRLTRREYGYTVKDLFGIDIDPLTLFPDDQTFGDGFDNDAATLTVEPLWFEKALAAADHVVHAVWADANALDRLVTKRPSPPLTGDSAAYVASTETSQRCHMGDGSFTVLARVAGESGRVFLRAPRGDGFVRGSMELYFQEDALVYRLQEGRSLVAENVEVGDGRPHWVGLTVGGGTTSLYMDGRLLVRRADFNRTRYQHHPLKIGRRSRRSDAAVLEFRFYGKGLSSELIALATRGESTQLPEPLLHWRPGMASPTPAGFVTVQEAGDVVISEYLRKVFRRPPTREEKSRYFQLFYQGIEAGLPFDLALQAPVSIALASPAFLFRSETSVQDTGIVKVASRDLASRLSYFLWSSMPDETLMSVAASGKLHDPDELIAQCERMLAHDKAERFFERFVVQWLRTEGLGETIKPDGERFPDVSPSLLASMRQESVKHFGQTVREDRPLLSLLNGDTAFVNEELASHYGYFQDLGPGWREVDAKGLARGGLLTQAAVLTVSSSPRRTSPVFRGKWVLEVLLGEPPPPPPANVPELANEAERGAASLRELLAQHRHQSACAGCHSRIDPYGFTLEQYDAVGRLRVEKQDTQAELVDGMTLGGVEDLKRYLVERKAETFLRHLTKRLLSYALGRELTFPDERPVQLILEGLQKKKTPGARDLIHAIVLSDPFLYRKAG